MTKQCSGERPRFVLNRFLPVVVVFAAAFALSCEGAADPAHVSQYHNGGLSGEELDGLSNGGTVLQDQAVARKLVQITPHERQIAWQELGFTAFLHFGPNTFTDREWGDGTESHSVFNPTALDTDQWCAALKAAGFQAAILTAKHHDGFCLWDTKTTQHNAVNTTAACDGHPNSASIWNPGDGKGRDIVKRFVESCKKYGLKAGIYLSPWDRNQGRYGIFGEKWGAALPAGAPAGAAANSPKQPWTGPDGTVYTTYTEFFIAQLTELLGRDPATGAYRYGELYAMWFDGAGSGTEHDDLSLYSTQPYDWPRIFATVRELQPNCVLTNLGPDAAWIGNESGSVLPSHWSVVPASQAYAANITSESQATVGAPPVTNKLNPSIGTRTNLADQVDLIWNPLEADVSIRPGWFFHPSQNPKSLTDLMTIYERCVGGNVQLLMNVPPDTTGKIYSGDAARLQELGTKIKGIYGKDAFPDRIFAAPAYTNPAGFTAAAETNLLKAPGVRVSSVPAADSAHPAANMLVNDDSYWRPKGEKEAVTITFTLPQAKDITHIMLQEQIRLSQRIESFSVEVAGADSKYTEVYKDSIVYDYNNTKDPPRRNITVQRNAGFKRICTFAKQTGVKYIRIKIKESRIYPTVKYVAAYCDPS